jgi:hypothetical protein
MPHNTSKRLRVLLVLDNLSLSGAEKVAVNMLRHAGDFNVLDIHGAVCMDDLIGVDSVAPRLTHLTPTWESAGSLLFRLRKALVAAINLRNLSRDFDLLVPVTPPAAIVTAIACLFSSKPIAPWVHYDLDGMLKGSWPSGRGIRSWLEGIAY